MSDALYYQPDTDDHVYDAVVLRRILHNLTDVSVVFHAYLGIN